MVIAKLLLIFSFAVPEEIGSDLHLHQNQPIDSAGLRQLLNEAWALTDSAEYEQALDMYDEIVKRSFEAKLWDGHIEALRGLGLNYTRLGKEAKSLEVRKQLVEASYKYLPIENINIGISEKELSISHQRMGNYDSAFFHIRKALAHNIEYIGENSITTSRSINSIGFLHSRLDELDSAVKYYQWALELLQKLEDKNYYQLGIAQNNLGAAYRKLGHYDLQADYLKQALESFTKSRGPNHPVLATIYNNLSKAYKQSGDFDNQLQFIEKALEIRKKNFEEVHPYIAESYTALAEFHLFHSENIVEFFTYANKALQINKSIFPETHEKIAASLHLLGKGYERENNYDLAYEQFKRSHEIYKSLWGEDHAALATELAGMADCSIAIGELTKAEEFLNTAMEIRVKSFGAKHPLIASLYKKLSELNIERNNYEGALEHIQAGIIALSSDFNELNLKRNPQVEKVSSKLDLLELLKMKGKVAHDLYDSGNEVNWLEISNGSYLKAIDLADLIRNQLISNQSKDQITELAFPAYQGAVSTAWKLHDNSNNSSFLDQIWSVVEKSRSFRLRLAQQKDNIASFGGVPDSLMQLEKSLILEITTLKESVARTDDSLKAKRLNNLLFTKELQFGNLKEHLKENHVQYYDLLHNLEVVSIEEVRSKLSNDEAIISYFSNRNEMYIQVVSKRKKFIKKLDTPNNYDSLLVDYRRSISDYQFLFEDPEKANKLYVQSASELYSIVLGPIIEELPSVSNLIIVPDDKLSTVNFEALLAGPVSTENYSNYPYAIKYHSFSYTHSVSHLFKAGEKRDMNDEIFGGFAPSYTSEKLLQDQGTSKMFEQLVRSGEWDLPGAREEVQEINKLFNGKTWLGDDATERDFVKNADNFSILHLAMHGLLDDEDPLSSELIFSLAADSVFDGHLSVREIYTIDMDAELVVLSACNSGFGQVRKGEGLISLSQAFQYAGCPSVVTSLWKVSDDATKILMINSYNSLANGHSKGESLRNGKLEFLNNVEDPLHAHPFYWAGFILMGDSGKLNQDDNSEFWILSSILGLVILSAGYVKLKKSKVFQQG